MAVTGPPEWRAGRALLLSVGGVNLLNALLGLDRADGDPAPVVLWSCLVAGSLLILVVAPARRVTTDDTGVNVRAATWRTTSVPWAEVADIRQRRPDRPGDPLVVVTRDGRELRTMLHPVEHRSLPRYWRGRVGLPAEPAA